MVDRSPGGLDDRGGATTEPGDGASTLTSIAGGLALTGDVTTGRWTFAHGAFPAEPGVAYRLTFEERLLDEGYDPGQRGDHWVALQFLDEGGGVVSNLYTPAQGAEWLRGSNALTAPPDAAPVRARLRGEADPAAFADGLLELLSPLDDGHVWIDRPGAARVATHTRSFEFNFALLPTVSRLRDAQRFDGVGLVGRTKEGGFGYALLDSFQVTPERFAPFEAAVRELLDAPGLVLDLRTCSGGDERLGRRIAGWLTDEPVTFARTAYRRGPDPADVGPWWDSVLPPDGETHYTGEVVALFGPACVSSGERVGQMLAAMGVTSFGATARGSSGNPSPLLLPNGVSVWYPRWVNENPDGTLVEGRGLAPDVPVAWGEGGDPVLDAAIAELRARVEDP